MTVTFRLCELYLVSAYLKAASIDIEGMRRSLALNQEALPDLKHDLAEAQKQRAEEKAQIEAIKAEAKAKMEAADRHLDKYCSIDFFTGERWETWKGIDPTKPDFNPEKLAAKNAFEAAEAAYKEVQYRYASEQRETEIVRKIIMIEDAIRSIQASIHAAGSELTRATEALPDGASALTRQQLERVASFDVDKCDPELLKERCPDRSDAELAGIIRGELPWSCPVCDEGYVVVKLAAQFQIVLDDEIRHPLCAVRQQWDASQLSGLIPPSHAHHRVHSLAPWSRSPIPEDRQQKPMSKIPSRAEEVRGWIMSGPAGTSKTTYAAAAITDMLTFRIAENSDPCDHYPGRGTDLTLGLDDDPGLKQLNYWRIKVPRWTREMEAWETRDFGDTSVQRPKLQPQDIEATTRQTGLPPLLWLEELDKFVPTKNRLRNIFPLIEAMYEAGGTIITTTNEKLPELKKLIGAPIYRRLSGENDDPASFLVWDFWSLAIK